MPIITMDLQPTSGVLQHPVSDDVLAAAEAWVRSQLEGHDASHDIGHILRVRNNVQALAAEEGLDTARQKVVELAALLHDVKDYKYSGDEDANRVTVQAFLSEVGLPEETISQVQQIISTVGFKDELKQNKAGQDQGGQAADVVLGKDEGSTTPAKQPALSLESAVLQDADRLDAIGAIGIARCFTFGGHFQRVLHDPTIAPRVNLTKEEYVQREQQQRNTTINHFYEKLLRLKDLMKTGAGQRRAQQRHAFMEAYLAQFLAEWEGQL